MKLFVDHAMDLPEESKSTNEKRRIERNKQRRERYKRRREQYIKVGEEEQSPETTIGYNQTTGQNNDIVQCQHENTGKFFLALFNNSQINYLYVCSYL